MTRRPEVIRSRSDAVQLWKYLLGRGISFHRDDDPSEWAQLSVREVPTVRRLIAEVDLLDDPGCYEDAVSLAKLASLAGTESVSRVPARHALAFQSCSTPVEAIWILENLH